MSENLLDLSGKIEPDLIQFATPVGLAVLKIIAWQDRSSDGSKDAQDLVLRILDHETDGPERHRLVEDMMQSMVASEELFDTYLEHLKALKRGIQDIMPEPVERLDNSHIVPAGTTC